MVIDNEFNIGDYVYLKTDEEQKKRIVTGIGIKSAGLLIYQVCCGVEYTDHYEFEMSETKNVLIG